jgi:hypothetical protein
VRRAILLTLLAALLAACSRVPERAEVIGFYVLDNSSARYTLKLSSDGTYVHSLVDKDGKLATKQGQWEWDSKNGDNQISLDNFVEFPGEDIGAAAPPSSYVTSPDYYWGRIRLRAEGDNNEYHFVRQ